MIPSPTNPSQSSPILLFDNECGVCRRIAGWVTKSAQLKTGKMSLVVRPIGDDPEALRLLNPALDIWQAYATIHVVMPDGSMKRGGEAVAEVLRELPNTSWLARSFAIRVFGFRPFQALLNVAYLILADVRPLFGCESCGTSSRWVRSIKWLMKWPTLVFGGAHQPSMTPHFTALAKAARPK
jgi:predicted DCC family thiol-disulfide oxidoreductase YuxK